MITEPRAEPSPNLINSIRVFHLPIYRRSNVNRTTEQQLIIELTYDVSDGKVVLIDFSFYSPLIIDCDHRMISSE